MKKLTKKLMLSILTVALTFIALGTSTFAWFAMNDQVNVSGMHVRTQVADNLFVVQTTLAATDKIADESTYKAATDFTTTAALLEPASSIDGINFFYTDAKTNVGADGKVIAQTYYSYNEAETSDFVAKNGVDGSIAYKDFVFELKAINTDTTNKKLKLTDINLVYNGIYVAEKAFRVAIFVDKYDETDKYEMVSTATMAAKADESFILAKASATYFTSGKAVNSITTPFLDTVTLATSSSAVEWDVTAQKTEYFKVVVRIWLEGEDTTCNNTTFASLNQNWVLDMKFILGGTATAVYQLNSAAIAATATAADTATVTLTTGNLSNGEAVATTGTVYQWYNADGTIISGANSQSYALPSTGSAQVYCKVLTAKGNVYYSDLVSITK